MLTVGVRLGAGVAVKVGMGEVVGVSVWAEIAMLRVVSVGCGASPAHAKAASARAATAKEKRLGRESLSMTCVQSRRKSRLKRDLRFNIVVSMRSLRKTNSNGICPGRA